MLMLSHLIGFDVGNNIVPSTTSITSTGAQNFVVPEYNVLVIDLWGAGASGAGNTPGSANYAGLAGGDTTISSLSLTAGGGLAGANSTTFPGPAGGTATGGDTNTAGNGAPTTSSGTIPGVGGAAPGPGGGTGGIGGTSGVPNGGAGSAPGAGGGGSYNSGSGQPYYIGGPSGAYLRKTYVPGTPGAPVPGTTLSVNIGVGGAVNPSGTVKGGIGANGKATFVVT